MIALKACPRCGGMVSKMDYDPVEGWTRGCFTCGWREYPAAVLPLVFERQLRRQESAETRLCEACGRVKSSSRFRSAGSRRCASCESAVWNARRREKARAARAAG